MKEFDTFLARAQARRAWLEQAATNCRARVRRERQKTERAQARRASAAAREPRLSPLHDVRQRKEMRADAA